MKQNNIEGGNKAVNIVDQGHGHEAEAQRLWEESERLKFIKDLKAGKTLAEAMSQFDLAEAFAEQPKRLGCSDGRIYEHRFGGAGNFILASAEERAKFIESSRGKIFEVKSHDSCGAAGIKFRQMQEAGETLPDGVNSPDELGKHFSRELSEKLGAKYGHTNAAEMFGPLHNERVIYLDGTGKFNPGALPELPAGFICSGLALNLSPEYCEKEIATLAKIAFGDHGFGERFNKDNPFYVVISADNQEQLNKLREIAEQAAGQFKGKMAVDGFMAK